MKKLLIIAIASSFLFISCAKVEPAPPAQATSVSKATSAPSASDSSASRITGIVTTAHCFTITNLETNPGVVEYVIVYTDCDGRVKKASLPEGQFLSACMQEGTITANFAYAIVACR